MKAGPATRTMVLTGLLVLVLTLADGPTQVSSHPAPEWVNFLSANTTFLGEPVPVDAVIVAFDPQGVQCGEFTVVEEGKYGFLPCYRDDDTTPEDDGADPGVSSASPSTVCRLWHWGRTTPSGPATATGGWLIWGCLTVTATASPML